jgi:hypothetical protein
MVLLGMEFDLIDETPTSDRGYLKAYNLGYIDSFKSIFHG